MVVLRNRDEGERLSLLTVGEMQPFLYLQVELARKTIMPDCSQEGD